MPSNVQSCALSSLTLFALVGCTVEVEPHGHSHGELEFETVLEGLNNPSSVSFAPDGRLTVCDAGPGRDHGNGRVLLWDGTDTTEYLTGFPTEYWKKGADGEPDRFKLGPLSSLWLADGRLLVSSGGLADGVDHLVVFEGAGTADTGVASNPIAPTSDDPADKGEGNLTGLSQDASGRVFVAGQGADAKSWVLTYDPSSGATAGLASADDAGVAINSPMATVPESESSFLALYSGAGGKDDGLIVRWNSETGELMKQWTLDGLIDPMGMALMPDGSSLVVVDNNWSLREVLEGTIAHVTLPTGGGAAEIEVLHEGLRGPTSCAFGNDGRLYVSLLGPEFDADQGSVVAIDGLH